MLPALLTFLAEQGLTLIRDAVVAKGQQVVEEKLGVKLSPNMSPDQVFQLKRIEMETPERLMALALDEKRIDAEVLKIEQQEVTKRWQGDMSSDSWLSKNIRPTVLIYLLGMVTVFALGSVWALNVAPAYITLVGDLLEAAFYAYFGGRTLEKGIKMAAEAWGKK